MVVLMVEHRMIVSKAGGAGLVTKILNHYMHVNPNLKIMNKCEEILFQGVH